MHPRPRPSTTLSLLGLVSLAAVACSGTLGPGGGSGSPAPSTTDEGDLAALTSYDNSAPLDLREESPSTRDEAGVTVHDVTWASPGGGRVSAWLVVPPGEGPFAGIVYLHGSETNRNDFLDEAIAMARGGAVSLVIDAPFARTGSSRRNFLLNFGLPERERAMNIQTIVDLRRAYDLLSARSDVDPARLGFVGHSWGASAGAVLAAVDRRPTALVLISGRPSWTGFLRDSTDGWVRSSRALVGAEKWEHYLERLAPFDALPVIGAIDPTRIYLQYGRVDDVVPLDVSAQLRDAALQARFDLYDAGHALDDAATADRVTWLVMHLGMEPVGAEVLATVGLPDE